MKRSRFRLWWVPSLLVIAGFSLFVSQRSIQSTIPNNIIFQESHSNGTRSVIEPSDLIGNIRHSETDTNATTAAVEIAPTSTTKSPFAYVFMAWRCDPSKRASYGGYIANILIATKLLRTHGSTADVVVVFQIQWDSPYHQLPQDIHESLQKLNVIIRYLPKSKSNVNVYGSMFTKFYIWNMTEYRRVLYLDSDIMPMTSLDYLMELSDQGILQEMVVLATQREPANGGFILVTPNATVYQHIQQIIKQWGSKLAKISKGGIYFNQVQGWGHQITGDDQWETNNPLLHGSNWTFYAANADQGFAYHYCKYVLKRCTQILSRKVTNFHFPIGSSPNNATNKTMIVQKEWTVSSINQSPFFEYSKRHYNFQSSKCAKFTGGSICVPPYSDFSHFTGRSKPWKQTPLTTRLGTPHTASHLWWITLSQIRNEFGINVSALVGIQTP